MLILFRANVCVDFCRFLLLNKYLMFVFNFK